MNGKDRVRPPRGVEKKSEGERSCLPHEMVISLISQSWNANQDRKREVSPAIMAGQPWRRDIMSPTKYRGLSLG
eukprot:1534788-Rhodomonas_salina.1